MPHAISGGMSRSRSSKTIPSCSMRSESNARSSRNFVSHCRLSTGTLNTWASCPRNSSKLDGCSATVCSFSAGRLLLPPLDADLPAGHLPQCRLAHLARLGDGQAADDTHLVRHLARVQP